MEVSFDVDINLEEENNYSSDDCKLHNDYDNQKLFDIYESYLNKSDISDSESEPELSFGDQFYQLVSKSNKTPITNRTIRQISSLADIENQTPRISRKSLLNESNQSLDESFSELSLPWNLREMSEPQIIELAQTLEEEVFNKEMDGPDIAAKHVQHVYDKQIQFFKQMTEESENKFKNCLQKISFKSEDKRLDFNELIGKQLESTKNKCKELNELLFQLNLIQQISKQ